MKPIYGALIAGLTASGAVAQQGTTVPATPPAPAAKPNAAQQAFDAAVAADQGTDPAAALAAWEALERRSKPGGRTHAIARARKSLALLRLSRDEEAAVAARSGLAAFPAADRTLDEDRMRAHQVLGEVARATLDYAGAAQAFAQMEALAQTPGEKATALIAITEVQTFVDPAAARATLARIDALRASTTFDKRSAALIARARTLLLLNTGDLPGARKSAYEAVTLLGGLTQTLDTLDVSARQDAAIAYLLGGDAEEARRYMAYTGAGRLPKGQFDPAAEMRPPDCGGEAGLKPEDMAVVEFSIAPDGTVSRATPIYAAGGGQVALEFARAAKGWSWPAEKVAGIPQFFRYNARVEMRCSTAFERPSIGDGLDATLEAWLETKGVTVSPAPANAAAALPAQRAAVAAAGGEDPRALAVAYRLASSPVLSDDERGPLYARAATIAAAQGAPPSARLALDLPARLLAVKDTWRPEIYTRAVAPLLDQPAYAADPQARAAIRLLLADAALRGRGKASDDRAATLLRQVADDAALARADPLKVGALIRIASIEERNGTPAAARTAYAQTGLAANQCAVMDSPPQLLSSAGAGNFPQEALRWGFEGWSQVQYDIAADGKTRSPRALISYPPFVFTKAATDFFAGARYAKTFRPDGELGCGGTSRRIRFTLSQ